MTRKILVDLSALKDIYCGLGQIALAYGRHFQENYKKENANYKLTLLLPKKWMGMFGNEVSYIDSTKWLNKRFLSLFQRFDVWHSIHQLARICPKNRKTKFILTVHDLNYLYERKGFSRIRKNYFVQKKINRADQIICISEFAKQEIENNITLNGKQCTVIYNGVEKLDEYIAKKPSFEIKQPYFFTIGVIEKKKNLHVLLDLMKQLPEKRLYIAGKENNDPKKNAYAQHIKQRIENEKITNVTLVGTVSHEEKIWLYKNCEAFLFPSLFEGFGLPIIEAMQFGKPVFSSKETSLKEISGNFSFFWTNFEPEYMKYVIDNNLENFYNDKQLIRNEIEYANSFSFSKHFEAYEKIYSNS